MMKRLGSIRQLTRLYNTIYNEFKLSVLLCWSRRKEDRILKMIFLNLNSKKFRVFLAVVVCCSIFYEKSCHAQFHWAKSGRREADLLKELLQDLVKESEEVDFDAVNY